MGAVLDTDTLTLHSGSSLVLDKSHIDLDGALMEECSVALFSNIGSLIIGDETLSDGATFLAQQYFTGSMIGENTTLVYDRESGTMTVTGLVPEPTTATLSLLALAALAARRRRK